MSPSGVVLQQKSWELCGYIFPRSSRRRQASANFTACPPSNTQLRGLFFLSIPRGMRNGCRSYSAVPLRQSRHSTEHPQQYTDSHLRAFPPAFDRRRRGAGTDAQESGTFATKGEGPPAFKQTTENLADTNSSSNVNG